MFFGIDCFQYKLFILLNCVVVVFFLQYLLVRHPLLSILFLTVVFFGVAMSGFSLFHLYLVLTNQTTNEFNKRWFGKTQNKTSRQARTNAPKTESTTNRTSKRRTTDNKKTSLITQTRVAEEKLQSLRTSTPYNRGIWANVAEVLQGWETILLIKRQHKPQGKILTSFTQINAIGRLLKEILRVSSYFAKEFSITLNLQDSRFPEHRRPQCQILRKPSDINLRRSSQMCF